MPQSKEFGSEAKMTSVCANMNETTPLKNLGKIVYNE